MLVYENYNKFMTATDTIRAMSGSMEGMDGRMAALRGLIGGRREGPQGGALGGRGRCDLLGGLAAEVLLLLCCPRAVSVQC